MVAEPFFMAFNAGVEFVPAMTGEDLGKDLSAVEAIAKKYM